MSTLIKSFSIFAVISFLVGACGGLPAPAEQQERSRSKAAIYQTILGKPRTDQVVTDFVASSHCSVADPFLLCKAIGIALQTDSNQVVETVYLYLNDTNGFEPYKGELPFGLKFYDTMAAVEYKLKRQGVGNAGLPDTGTTPDYMHYRATYHQAGMTIIYNYPFPDEGATIYAILVKQIATVEDKS